MNSSNASLETYKISQFGEPYLYSVNRNTFEAKTTATVFSEVFNDKLWQEDYLNIIIGSDSGLLIDYVLEQGPAKGSKYLFIESDHVINNIEKQLTFTKSDENVVLTSFDNWLEHAENFNLQGYMYTDKVRYLNSSAAIDGFDLKYNQIGNSVRLDLETIQHRSMVTVSRAPFVARQIENLGENGRSLDELNNTFEGHDCIVLGGGPSLDESIDWLYEVQNDIIIFAVSRVSKRLQEKGITPHFVVSVDPHDVSFDVSKDMFRFANDSIFIHSSYVSPKILGQWSGLSYHDGARVPWPNDIWPTGAIMAGPTVTNSAISAAVSMGFKNIYITGMDLCHSPTGNTHAQGSNEAKIGPILGKKEQWVKTYSGRLAETIMTFIHASKTIAEQASMANELGCNLFNLSPNAAAVDNISLKETRDIKLPIDKKHIEILGTIKQQPTKASPADLKMVLDEIDRIKSESEEILEISQQALSDNTKLYNPDSDDKAKAELSEKIDEAEQTLTEKYQLTSTFIKKYGIQRFIRIAQTQDSEHWSEEKMEEIGRKYYQSYIDTVNQLLPLLEVASNRTQLRIDEQTNSFDVEKAISIWTQDKQLGRALIFKEGHADFYNGLNDDNKAKIDTAIDEFNNVLADENTFHLKRTQAESSLARVTRKAFYLYQTRNFEALELLYNNLTKVIDKKPEAKDLATICNAYYLLMQQQFDKSLSAFLSVPEPLLSEDELVHIAAIHIELKQYQEAEQRLEKLATIAEQHRPKYAIILNLNGKRAEAIEQYQAYLEANQLDLSVWLSLAKLYVESGDFEAATNALENVLIIDPENNEAIHFMNQVANAS